MMGDKMNHVEETVPRLTIRHVEHRRSKIQLWVTVIVLFSLYPVYHTHALIQPGTINKILYFGRSQFTNNRVSMHPSYSSWFLGASSIPTEQGPLFPPDHTKGVPTPLQAYWGHHQPVLIRKAFHLSSDDAQVWPTWSDIVALACTNENMDDDDHQWNDDQDMDSGESARLIHHIPGQLDTFTLELGPFSESFVQDYGLGENDNYEDGATRCWTLLVNDVDRYKHRLSHWMDLRFGTFLPRWRRDDAQISIAPTGGGIGPHVDNYDVFLLQTSGTRKWRVTQHPISVQTEMNDLIPNLTVRILQNETYSYYEDIELQAGDMLYIPPRFVHWGTSVSMDCVTLSVGCRAPSASELVARIAEATMESVSENANRRYSEKLSSNNGTPVVAQKVPSLTDTTKAAMKQLVLDAVKEVLDDDMTWNNIVGNAVTEPKRFSEWATRPLEEVLESDDGHFTSVWGNSAKEILSRVRRRKDYLQCIEGLPTASAIISGGNDSNKVVTLFCNGERYEVICSSFEEEKVVVDILERIEAGEPVLIDSSSPETSRWLEALIEDGVLYPVRGME